MWVCIRISDWKSRKLFQSSWIWLCDYKQQMQILLHDAHSQQDRDKAREMLGHSVKKPQQNLACLSSNAPKERGWKAVLPHVYFLPRRCQNIYPAALERDWKYFTALLQVYFLWKKRREKKKTEDLCSWVNFHLKPSSAVRQNSRISLKQRCACCHTLLCAFLDAHRWRYQGYRRFIQPDPCCWALGSTALENKQTNQ